MGIIDINSPVALLSFIAVAFFAFQVRRVPFFSATSLISGMGWESGKGFFPLFILLSSLGRGVGKREKRVFPQT